MNAQRKMIKQEILEDYAETNQDITQKVPNKKRESKRNRKCDTLVPSIIIEHWDGGVPRSIKLLATNKQKDQNNLPTEPYVINAATFDDELNMRETFSENGTISENQLVIDDSKTTTPSFLLPRGPPFICDICSYRTNFKNAFTVHRRRKHECVTTGQPHKCDICGFLVQTRFGLKKHRQRKHPNCI